MSDDTDWTVKHDDRYQKAVDIVIGSQNASISFLQRNLLIGYNRAARMIEAMEVQGIVGPLQSDGTRKVVVVYEH